MVADVHGAACVMIVGWQVMLVGHCMPQIEEAAREGDYSKAPSFASVGWGTRRGAVQKGDLSSRAGGHDEAVSPCRIPAQPLLEGWAINQPITLLAHFGTP